MKAPANFTASATKKINPLEAAINSNFSQGSPQGSLQGPTQASSQLSVRPQSENPAPNAREAVLAGGNSNYEGNTPAVTNSASILNEKSQISNGREIPESSQEKSDSAKVQPRREVKEKFLVSMSKGERSVFKAFCAMQNVSMNHFVMCAMDYFKEDLENGKVSLSAHSYKRKES